MQLITIVAMLFSIAGVAFALQNNVPITLTFLLWRFDSSLALVVLMALAVGGLIVALVSTPSTLRNQWALRGQRKRIAELEQNNDEQKQRIQTLERQVPYVESVPVEAASYVGLKQIIAGQDNEGVKHDT